MTGRPSLHCISPTIDKASLTLHMARSSHNCWRWIAGIGIAFALLCATAISQAGRFLEAPGSAPSKADVLVALGGESGDRALTAASLFRDGFAPRMLVTGMDTSPNETVSDAIDRAAMACLQCLSS